ncbi:MAG TPA: ABC transporter permease [Chryseosolibacter sp.]|nr:ABC transporter permease [Chryseosolibacter sp.]
MLLNYITIMLRNMASHKAYAGITVLGLTCGITFSLLIGVFVWTELQVNQNLKDVERLFLLEGEQKMPGSLPAFFVPAPLGQRATEKYPQVFENYYRFRDREITVSKGDNHLRIQSMLGDATLISMFGFEVVNGHPDEALDRPDAMVVTEKIARQFFGRSDVVGETLSVSTENNGIQEYQITAVIADLQSKNSVSDFMNMNAQVFLSHANRANFNLGGLDDWGAWIITYLKLAPATTQETAAEVLNELIRQEGPEDLKGEKAIDISLQPLSSYYLITNHGAVRNLLVALSVITSFILLLAIVNFVNITIARSFSRLREVGVRKSIGGTRLQVAVQFLSESVMLASISLILSIMLYQVLHGYVGDILGMALPSITDLGATVWIAIVSGTFLLGLVAGAYPAIRMSAARTTDLMKKMFKSAKGNVQFSRPLIGVQFAVAVFILTVSLIMSRQIEFVLHADPGYDRAGVMIVSSVPRLWNEEGFSKMEAAKNTFLGSPRITSVALSWGAPNFNFSPYSAKVSRSGASLEDGPIAILSAADEDYSSVYRIDMASGKFFFTEGEPRLPNQVVINESMQKALSLEVGDQIHIEFSDNLFTVAGIVKDFNFESFHRPIEPMVFVHTRDFQAFRYFSLALAPGNLHEAVGEMEQLWTKVFPNDPFVYHFADARMETIYRTELQLKKASAVATVLILIIVFTGVIGLVSVSAARRTKEIGIRKTFGASVSNILRLFANEYLMILFLSFLVGVPLSALFGLRWLSSFAYRVNIQWWLFGLPVIFLTLLTLLIVISQSLKVSLSSPVNALRHE